MWARTQLAWHKKLPFNGEHLKLMGQLFDYLRAIESWADLDGGHWEEHSAIHASSIGPPLAAVKLFTKVAARDGFLPPCKSDTLEVLEKNLQAALLKILPGEITFPAELARDADAAAVFLAYPLEVVDDQLGLQIMERLTKVMGHIGMCRYRKDSYWCKDYKDKVGDDPTKHFTDEELKERDRLLQEGEEAQWCLFDPMVSAFYGRMYQKTQDEKTRNAAERRRLKDAQYLKLQQLFLARSLAAITGDDCPYGPWHCAEERGRPATFMVHLPPLGRSEDEKAVGPVSPKSFSNVIEAIGFGIPQLIVAALCGFIWAADGAELLLLESWASNPALYVFFPQSRCV
ncbi:unnamed protein product [Durusdinium trenchii]|uniref:Uncharacterized protein n=1 Tax=Durusdinium trenchii TaxID=1381693 RepID=A0ABP0MZ57_9DINO